jgi:hypothetical protein
VPQPVVSRRSKKCILLLKSLDDLVGARNYCRWHVEAERLGGFQIDDQLVLGRVLHRQVGRFFALEDAIHVCCCAVVWINAIRAVRNKASFSSIEAVGVNSRQPMTLREHSDQLTVADCRGTGSNDESTVWGTRESTDAPLDLSSIS